MLYFTKDEMRVCEEKRRCKVCKERKATWVAKLRETEDETFVCAHCLMYSNETQWGYDNRAELLDVGRAVVEQAVKSRKSLPTLDKRGRLSPDNAEKFIMGVSFTSRMIVDRFGVNVSD